MVYNKSINLYHSQITKNIFSNLEKEDKTIITQINGKTISSFEFKKDIFNLAKNLSEFGLKKDERIAILIRDNIIFSNLIISSVLCGGSIVLLDPGMGKTIMLDMIKTTGISILFLEGILYDHFFLTRSPILYCDIEIMIYGWTFFGNKHRKVKSLLKQNDSEYQFIESNEESESIVVFTGGNTGNPKGVIHSLGSIYQMLTKIQGFCTKTKIFYSDMPHFLLLGILSGTKTIVGPYNIKPRKLIQVLHKYKVDTYFSPPYKYNYFIEHSIPIPETLVNILLGSAPIYRGFLEKLLPLCYNNQDVTCIYGMTEMLPIASISGREKLLYEMSGDVLGYPLLDIEYQVIEDELFVRGPHMLSMYIGGKSHEYIQTGDLVNIQDNMMIMMGRKKDMIIRKEYNIYPGLYESIISRIPGVQSCAMIGVYNEKIHDERIVLYVELISGFHKYSESQFYKLLKYGDYSIDEFALPDTIIFKELSTVGRQKKIDKTELRKASHSLFL